MSEQKKRRTEITIETHQLTIIRQRIKSIQFICPICRMETVSLLPVQAALAFQVTEAVLETLVTSNLIHSADIEGYCGNSLAEHFKKEIRW